MRVALALGSGGARGYAHIGAIRELEARGHEIVAISGSSMGAVVGGMYAAGKLDEFETWIRSLNQRNVLMLVDPAMSRGGAIRARRLTAKLSEILDGARIEDLRIPFTAVSTDLQARREVWFTRGPLDVAMRASYAIPSVITPAMVGGRIMIDGGVLNPVPMEPLLASSADLVVAVSLTGRKLGDAAVLNESSDGSEGRSWRRQRMGERKRAAQHGDEATAGAEGAAMPLSETDPAGPTAGSNAETGADSTDAAAVQAQAVRGEAQAEDRSEGKTEDTVTARAKRDKTVDKSGDRAGSRGEKKHLLNKVDGLDKDIMRVVANRLLPKLEDSELGKNTTVSKVRKVIADRVPEMSDYDVPEDAESDITDVPDDESFGVLPKSFGLFDVVVQALDAVEATITNYRMAGNPPDVLVDVPAELASAFDFHRAEEIITYGQRLTATALDRAGF